MKAKLLLGLLAGAMLAGTLADRATAQVNPMPSPTPMATASASPTPMGTMTPAPTMAP